MSDEMMQKDFGSLDAIPSIVNASEPHMACLLLLDTSGSMYGNPIDELNAGLNKFKADVCEDKTTRDVLDIAIVEFNSSPSEVQEFVPIEYMKPVTLKAGGGTNMTPAIRQAVDMVTNRSRFYRLSGTEPYKPWIILISDGAPTDDITEVAKEIQSLEEDGKLKFFSLGVGEYDPKTLHMLSGPKVMKLKGYDFTSFFDWVNKSMRSVSVSSPGQAVSLPALPAAVDKDVSDWGA